MQFSRYGYSSQNVVPGGFIPLDEAIYRYSEIEGSDPFLRGRWWCGSRVGLSDHPRCCFLAPFSTPLCESMEQLLTAANSISQRSIHDFSTTPHDRGHANPQLSSEYPKILCPTGLAVRAVLPEVTRSVGA